ncbi:acetyltransferase [Lutibacter sp. A64]|uniref:acetyltransferase n=1 Tax=Lutibacter sp. A64 TaxID=2918526 RepID=UPI001F053468|nr:acetyltransferase [Lutibacter sp. A64]UMB55456.1 acetyltransferase [Lutibacter sp. A64]
MYLYGASGHCKVIIDSIESSTSKKIDGIFDDNTTIKELLSIPVFDYDTFDKELIDELIVSVGINSVRKFIVGRIQANYGTVIHSKAYISKYAFIDKGTAVMAHAVVNASAKIGKHCIVNTGAIVEHDCELEDFVHISPNASLAGNVKVGEGSHIGIGAQVIQGITIGKWVTIGAGTVVIRDIPDNGLYVGNPAREIKK